MTIKNWQKKHTRFNLITRRFSWNWRSWMTFSIFNSLFFRLNGFIDVNGFCVCVPIWTIHICLFHSHYFVSFFYLRRCTCVHARPDWLKMVLCLIGKVAEIWFSCSAHSYTLPFSLSLSIDSKKSFHRIYFKQQKMSTIFFMITCLINSQNCCIVIV